VGGVLLHGWLTLGLLLCGRALSACWSQGVTVHGMVNIAIENM